jgi:hypothetical protein
MKNDDDLKNKIELAGLKGNRGLDNLAKYAPLLSDASFLQRINQMLDLKAVFAPDPHPFPSPDDDELPPGGIPFVRMVRMDGTLGPWVPLPTGVMDRHPHILIAGAAGAGKSWTVCHTIQNLTLSGFGSLVLDTEGEYSNLMLYLPDGLCWVFDDMTFKRNPLQPLPGEEQRRTYGRVKRVFRETFLRDGSINLLGEELVSIVDAAGQVATLYSLLGQLGRAKYRLDSRRGQYLESLKNRLGNIVEFVSIYDCREGFDIRVWLRPRCMVLRLTALSDELKDFVVNDLVATIQDWTQENPGSGLRLIIVIDEAHRFFAPGKAARYDLGDPILLDAARTLRKRGVNLILSTQVFRDLPVAALANISTFLIFRTSEGSCIRAIGQALSLSSEQMEYLPKLGERRAVMKHPLIPDPFIVELPELDFSQRITEQEIRERMAPVLQSLRWVPRSVSEESNNHNADGATGAERRRGRDMASPPKEELDYLESIARNPFVPVTERDRKLGLSTYKGNKLRKDFCERELIRIHHVEIGKRGGGIALVEVTSKGWELLERYKVNVRKPAGKGGLIHQYWQQRLQKWFLQNYPGCKATIEQMVEGKAVDVGVEIEGRRIAVEIMIKGEEKELVNIVKDLEVGFDEVVIVTEDKETGRSLERKIGETLGDKYGRVVSIRQLKEFYMEGAKDIGQYA